MVDRNFNDLSRIDSRSFRQQAVALALLTGFEAEKLHTVQRHKTILANSSVLKLHTMKF